MLFKTVQAIIAIKMCGQKCRAKWVICLIGAAAIVVVILATVVHFSSDGSNEVKMVGSGEVANFKESSGLHLLEIEAPEAGTDEWSILEIGFVVLAFKLGLIVTHGLHYCFVTRSLVKKKVAKSMELEMMKLTPKPPLVSGTVEVPAL